jgi:hypothetical protein
MTKTARDRVPKMTENLIIDSFADFQRQGGTGGMRGRAVLTISLILVALLIAAWVFVLIDNGGKGPVLF